MKIKLIIINAFGIRVLDSEPEVRREAFLRLNQLKIRIQDFEGAETKLFILQQGIAEEDGKTKEAFLSFMRNSIVKERNEFVKISSLTKHSRKVRDQNSLRRRSSMINKNSRHSASHDPDRLSRSSVNDDMSIDEADCPVTKKVFSFASFLRDIDIKQAFTKE